jgi:peptidoglycan/xylan/chitin deacetylase (PgdA/CDA1 family)
VGNIGGENEWDGGGEKLLSYENIREMAANKYIEFGLHSYRHQSYGELDAEEAAQDIDNCITALKENHIPFIPVLAYPYGAYPKKDEIKKERLFDMLRKKGIKYALRIGNGLNRLPFKNPFEIKRVNVRGSDSFLKFKVKLRKGHVKLFE